jgi:outer membrane lipoprotein-sorting protein
MISNPNYRYILPGILLCLCTFYSKAQDDKERPMPNPDQLIEKLNAKAQSISTFQCEFKQVKYLAYLDVSVESSGKFTLKKKNQVRWEYIEPYKYVLVIKDGKMSIKDFEGNKDLKQKGNKFLEHLNELVESLFLGNIGINQDFKKEFFENDLSYNLTLTPKLSQTKNDFKQINIYFEKFNLEVTGIKITESSGDFTSLLFKNRIYNRPIDDSYFTEKE